VPDVSKLVPTRPWIESLKDKSIVEIELAAALVLLNSFGRVLRGSYSFA